MSDIPSWASDFDSCALQCLGDAIDAAGCADLSDTACFCEEDALLAMTLGDSLILCLGLTCDPYLVGTAFQDMITYCRLAGAWVHDIRRRGWVHQDNPGSNKGVSGSTGGGLSAGAKGGIAGGVVAAALLLLALLFFVLRRRRAAKNSAPASENTLIDAAEKRDTPGPGNGVQQQASESQAAAWEELGGKEIGLRVGSSARGRGSIVELGPNTPRPRCELPGEQSLGYSSVVAELESYPPATTNLERQE